MEEIICGVLGRWTELGLCLLVWVWALKLLRAFCFFNNYGFGGSGLYYSTIK